MPRDVARSCSTEKAGSAAEMMFLLYLDASPGDKSDRETVYNRVVSSVPVDIAKLYQYLVDWRFYTRIVVEIKFLAA